MSDKFDEIKDMEEVAEILDDKLQDEADKTETQEGSATETEIKDADDPAADNESESDADPDPQQSIPIDLARGVDSTSVPDIIEIIDVDNGELLGDSKYIDELDDFLDPDTSFESNEKKLDAGQDLLRRFFSQHNRSWSAVLGTFAGYSVDIGRILHELKALVKACGKKWEPWAAENLVFMKPRTRQAFMQLATVSGIDEYLHLGKERLLLLESATKGSKSEDRIGDFLKSHGLYFDAESEIDLDAYKEAIDIALDHERVRKAGINAQQDSIAKFKADGKKIDGGLIKLLKAVQSSGGDPNNYLKDPPEDADKDDGKKRVQSFKKLAVSLQGTISWILDNSDYIKEVDIDLLEGLEARGGPSY